MLRVTLRNIWAHKRRLVSTIVAILLGVAFMSGTLVLTGTLDRSFDEIFQTSSKGIDAEERGEELFDADFGGTSQARLEAALVEAGQGADGVRLAAWSYSTDAVQGHSAEGDKIGPTHGPPPPTEKRRGEKERRST